MASVSVNPARNFRPFQAAREMLADYERQSPAVLAVAEQAIGGVLVIDGLLGSANPFSAGRKNGVWGNFISLLVGIVLLAVVPLFFNTLNYEAYTAKTTATVTNVIPHSTVTYKDNRRHVSTTCELVARFFASNGQPITAPATSSSSGYCSYERGSTIDIQYNPANYGQWDTPGGIKTFGIVKVLFTFIPWLIILTSAWGLLLKGAAIVFGVIIWRRGRALAKRYPDAQVDAQQIEDQVRDFFQRKLWGFNS